MGFVLTIDGPAAAGKSSTAREVAARLGFVYLDTGALYRALAVRILEEGIAPDDVAAAIRAVRAARLELAGSPRRPRVLLDGRDVSEEIRTPAVAETASRLASHREVRVVLTEVQKGIARRAAVVAEGRDLGTVVFPDADLKVYLDADAETRARRRHRELQERGFPVTLEAVGDELRRRDERDRTREESPLRVPEGAVVLDTSGMTVEEQVEAVLRAYRTAARGASGATPAGA